jgi:uncharacterized damage-inducible protein DinB
MAAVENNQPQTLAFNPAVVTPQGPTEEAPASPKTPAAPTGSFGIPNLPTDRPVPGSTPSTLIANALVPLTQFKPVITPVYRPVPLPTTIPAVYRGMQIDQRVLNGPLQFSKPAQTALTNFYNNLPANLSQQQRADLANRALYAAQLDASRQLGNQSLQGVLNGLYQSSLGRQTPLGASTTSPVASQPTVNTFANEVRTGGYTTPDARDRALARADSLGLPENDVKNLKLEIHGQYNASNWERTELTAIVGRWQNWSDQNLSNVPEQLQPQADKALAAINNQVALLKEVNHLGNLKAIFDAGYSGKLTYEGADLTRESVTARLNQATARLAQADQHAKQLTQQFEQQIQQQRVSTPQIQQQQQSQGPSGLPGNQPNQASLNSALQISETLMQDLNAFFGDPSSQAYAAVQTKELQAKLGNVSSIDQLLATPARTTFDGSNWVARPDGSGRFYANTQADRDALAQVFSNPESRRNFLAGTGLDANQTRLRADLARQLPDQAYYQEEFRQLQIA